MVLNINNQKLSNPEILSVKFNENNLSIEELTVVKLAKEWLSGVKNFKIRTSGSTGAAKEISLSAKKLEYSARSTMQVIDPKNHFRTALLCINPDYIGGKMVVIRSLLYDLELTVIPPSSNPFEGLGDQTFDLVSMVPLQVQTLLENDPEKLAGINTLLIGGAPLSSHYQEKLRRMEVKCFHTYGMTETASHVALDDLSKEIRTFKTIGDVIIDQDERGCLKLKGTLTDHTWLQTNDIVSIENSTTFIWKGRADFVINSGGVKVHPEMLEPLLNSQIDAPFFIGGLPHPDLGQQVTLIIEGPQTVREFDFHHISPYERPKKVIFVPNFIYTRSGKVDRPATLKTLTS